MKLKILQSIPGRFDIKLCLGNCSSKMYADILGAFFQLEEKDKNIIYEAQLTPKKWSPLEVINTAIIKENIQDTLNSLK